MLKIKRQIKNIVIYTMIISLLQGCVGNDIMINASTEEYQKCVSSHFENVKLTEQRNAKCVEEYGDYCTKYQ
jgi:hypothetical protein